ARYRYYLAQLERHRDRVRRELNTRRRYSSRLVHNWRCGVDGDAERTRGRAGMAGDIGGGGGQAVAAVGKRRRGIGPVAAAIGGDTAEQRDPVIDLDRGIGLRA